MMKRILSPRRIMRLLACLLMAALLTTCLSGCTTSAKGADLMKDISPNPPSEMPAERLAAQAPAATDFGVRLLKAFHTGEKNTLISPLSVLSALAMTANGAKGYTLSQMQQVLGSECSELNAWIYAYRRQLAQSDDAVLHLANGIWFTEDEHFTVNEAFLQTNADFFGAELRQAPFNDATCREINRWVKEQTNGMVTDIVDQIPEDAVMYLVNALAFEAQWRKPYQKDAVREAVFTGDSGETKNLDFMYGSEGLYLEDEQATGFIKPYMSRKYAFAALLPREGIRLEDYVAGLDGHALHALLSSPQRAEVHTAIPKFDASYDAEMSELLAGLGMSDAFDDKKADFSDLGSSSRGNIYIGRVLHKTFLSMGEKGTKAGAATVVAMEDAASMEITDQPKQVYLDRPFVYMLIDLETALPLFIGTMLLP